MRNSLIASWIVVTVFCLPVLGESVKELTLAEGGQSRYQIVLRAGAHPSEVHAGELLQKYFKECTGAELPVAGEGQQAADRPMIVLGRCELAKGLGVNPTEAEIGRQGYSLQRSGDHIVIAGTAEVGTLYGTVRFLEMCLGVRWYAPDAMVTPKTEKLPAGSLAEVYQPPFEYRTTTYLSKETDKDFLVWAGYNSGLKKADNPQGLQVGCDGICHTYFLFIDPKEYFESHPEYFSEIGGKRVREQTQLCLTNPEVLEIVTAKMLERMRKNPHYRQHNFSQMDWYNYCQCKECRAINAKYKTNGGTQFWFVNQLAERTAKEFPEKLIGTLAYQFSEEAPTGLAIHPNVSVWLCHMYPSCDSHPVATCEKNADYKRRAEAWSKLCKQLYVWHYITNFSHYYVPFPNLRAMWADLRFYRDIGVKGLFLQGKSWGDGGGEFCWLRSWYGMKLAWNPDTNPDALLEDFLHGYYGAAGDAIRKYIDLIHDKVQGENIHMHLYTNPGQGYLPDEVLTRAEQLFDQAAEAVKGDPALRERVDAARMPVEYARLFPRNGYRIENGRLVFNELRGSVEGAQAFLNKMSQYKFTSIREFGDDPKLMLFLGKLQSLGTEVITVENESLSADVVPELAGRVLRIIHKPTGQCVTGWNNVRDLRFPFCGGLSEGFGEMYSMDGSLEPAMILEKSAGAVTLRMNTFSGLQLTRTVELAEGSASLSMTTTVSNPTDKDKRTRYRLHLTLDAGALPETKAEFVSRGGKDMQPSMADVLAGMLEGMRFYDADAPAGAWTFRGTKGLKITQRFEEGAVDFGWLHGYPQEHNELHAELWGMRLKLPAKGTLTFRQSLEVQAVK